MPVKIVSKISRDARLELVKQVGVVTGKNTVQVIEILFEKSNVNEFLIAKKLGMTINQIRNMLYKLSDEGLVSFIRKKDKRKGWYTYFWTFDSEKAFVLLKKVVLKEIAQFENELASRNKKRFYKSPGINIEYTEEKALEYDFICPETGEVMELKDNSKEIKELELHINKFKRKLIDLSIELELLFVKKLKDTERREKKEKKEKAEKRAANKLAREKEAKKLGKIIGKKKIKKPVKKIAKKKSVKKIKKPVKKIAKKKSVKKIKKPVKKIAKKKSVKK
ncbi:MAG: hypothetical protein U9Q06_00395 [Nanoarchaeota archaeon]|nr:hypothetical protein [Nanoarchaeota archaeon]